MADVEIKGRITVDTAGGAKSIADLNKEIRDSKKALQEAAIGSDEYKAAHARLQQAQDTLKTSTAAANAEHGKSGEAFGILKERIGSMAPAFKGAEGGVGSLSSAFKALLANPIVLIIAAIVAGLKLLYDAFTSTDEGAQKVQGVFDGLGAVVRELFERISHVASAIVKLFSGDFKGAMEEGEKAVNNFGDAMVDSFKRGKEASDLLDEVADNVRVLDIQYAAMNARLAKSKELLNDENASFADKRKALKETTEAQDKYYKNKLENDNKELAAIGKKYNVEDELAKLRKKGFEEGAKEFDDYLQTLAIGAKGMEEIENSIKKIIDSGAQQSANVRQANKINNSLDKQEAAERKAQWKEELDRRKEAAQKAKEFAEERKKLMDQQQKQAEALAKAQAKGRHDDIAAQIEYGEQLKKAQDKLNADSAKQIFEGEKIKLTNKKKAAEFFLLKDPNNIQNKIDKINADLNLELHALADGDIQRNILAKKASDEIVKINADEVEAKRQLGEAEAENKAQMVNRVGGMLNQLSGIVGTQTAAGKGLAIAASLIDTYSAITATLKAAAKGPGGAIPGYAIAQSIITGIAGFATVAKIASVKVPGGASAGVPSGATALSAPAPLRPQQSSTQLDQSTINGIGNAAQGGVGRSFVLDADITNASERNARINRAARLG